MPRAKADARSAKRKPKGGDESDHSGSRVLLAESAGVALLGLSAFAALALARPDEAGELAPGLNDALFFSLGYASWLLVAAFATLGLRLMAGRGLPRLASRFWLGAGLLMLATASTPPLFAEIWGSGTGQDSWLGGLLSEGEARYLGHSGALLLNGVLFAIGVMTATGVSSSRGMTTLGVAAGGLMAGFTELMRGSGRALLSLWSRARRALAELTTGFERGWRSIGVWKEQRARHARVERARRESAPEELAPEIASASAEIPSAPRPTRKGGPEIIDHGSERQSQRVQQEAFTFSDVQTGPYQLPDAAIFQEPPQGARSYDRESLIMNSRILEKKLLDFGVGGSVVTVHPGPVITMYEFEPASGIKVNKIVSLADDLALALRALSVRIIAPLPGKSVVGVEVANPQRETVYLRDLLECENFKSSSALIPVALGKDIFGNPLDADLAKMPHLLVAGATGTGKSVFLNSLLCSILYRKTPDELKLLLIDPKLLELSVYAGVPHLVADVVTNPKRASAALAGIVRKMEQRYQQMAALGVRSIQQFNERCEKELQAGETSFQLRPRAGEEVGEEVPYEKLPYIVVVIDELADLMVVCSKDVEESLQRLAQMARAAGIHLVLATQRPSVDVLTGVIKANFPARISFQVSSRTDSRTILDQNGADHLLGAGDMLFLPPGTSKLQRLHGALVTEEEVSALTSFLQSQGSPNFDESLNDLDLESDTAQTAAEDVDEMYDAALALVAETRNASISYVQRRLKVGYNRAARMIEQMENEGVVGPQVGSKPREVYVSNLTP
ncbi:MAG: DNA translocase FtsK 4TM domain-containing protein [Myxococcota bacterium]